MHIAFDRQIEISIEFNDSGDAVNVYGESAHHILRFFIHFGELLVIFTPFDHFFIDIVNKDPNMRELLLETRNVFFLPWHNRHFNAWQHHSHIGRSWIWSFDYYFSQLFNKLLGHPKPLSIIKWHWKAKLIRYQINLQ